MWGGIHAHLPAHGFVHVSAVSAEARKGAEITSEPPDMSAGNRTPVLCKSSVFLNR